MVETPFVCWGQGSRVFDWFEDPVGVPKEALLEGPAGTGKTRLLGEWIKQFLGKYPDSKGLLLRKTRVSLNDSFLPIWEEEVLNLDHPAVIGRTREHRDSYKHPTLGGELRLGGMDNPTRLFSTQYNFIAVNEATELSKDEWESLHRALRRQGTPFRILIGDCNPDAPGHWLNKRCKEGVTERIKTLLSDNPRWFNHAERVWTPDGVDYLSRLSVNLSGPRFLRLFKGEWATAEGMVWPQWDPDVHMITAELGVEGGYHTLQVLEWDEKITLNNFIGSFDWGVTNPSVAQIWGFDLVGRAYRVAEVYRRGLDTEEWVEQWKTLCGEFRLDAVICDHEPAFIKMANRKINQFGSDNQPMFRRANKRRQGEKGQEKVGIDEVRQRLRRRDFESRPGLLLLRDALRGGRDPFLVQAGLPVCTEDEIPSYVYAVPEDGKTVSESPIKVNDHGVDALRMAMSFVSGKLWVHGDGKNEEYAPGTYGEYLKHGDVFAKHRDIYKGRRWQDGKLVDL